MKHQLLLVSLLSVSLNIYGMYKEYTYLKTYMPNPTHLASAYSSNKIAIGSASAPSSVFSCITTQPVQKGNEHTFEKITPYFEPVTTFQPTHTASTGIFFTDQYDLCHVIEPRTIEISGIEYASQISDIKQKVPVDFSCFTTIEIPFRATQVCIGSAVNGAVCIWNIEKNKPKVVLNKSALTPIKDIAALSYSHLIAVNTENAIQLISLDGLRYTYYTYNKDTISFLKGPSPQDLTTSFGDVFAATNKCSICRCDMREAKLNTVIKSSRPIYDLIAIDSSLCVATDNGKIKLYDLKKADSPLQTLKSSEYGSSILKLVKRKDNDIVALSQTGVISYWSNHLYPE